MSSYHYLGERANDRHVRRLYPTDTALHDQWLQAVAERSPEERSAAEGLVLLLREQTKSSIRVTDIELAVNCDGYAIRRHLHQLFEAGLVSARHRFPSPHKIRLCLP